MWNFHTRFTILEKKTAMVAPTIISTINVIDDRSQSLQTFDLLDLQKYTQEKSFSINAIKDFHLFFVGHDDELNDILMAKAADPIITMLITLDKSQAGEIHEKKLLDSDTAKNPKAFNTYFVIGESATHQISHTKGFVTDGKVGGEGSTNWSTSGEGTFVITGKAGGPG